AIPARGADWRSPRGSPGSRPALHRSKPRGRTKLRWAEGTPVELNEILKIALKGGASDIHLKPGLPAMFRVDGALVPLKSGDRLTPDAVQQMAHGIMNSVQKQRFEDTREVDLAYGIPGLGRFRVNVFQQRGTVGIVFRAIPFGVKTIEQLVLPKVIESIAMEHRGLVLVTG